MTKSRYDFLKSAAPEAEAELCDLIAAVLEERSQRAKHDFNHAAEKGLDEPGKQECYWLALALDHAAVYVEDWKQSI